MQYLGATPLASGCFGDIILYYTLCVTMKIFLKACSRLKIVVDIFFILSYNELINENGYLYHFV